MMKLILLIGALLTASVITFAQYWTGTEAKKVLCEQIAEKRDVPLREEMKFLHSELGGN